MYISGQKYIDELIANRCDTDGDGSLDVDYYFTHDANFNVTSYVARVSAEVGERYIYDPYGCASILEADWSADADGVSDVDNDVLFQGRPLDTGTGLYDFRHRMYHPTLGRWMQRDPVGYVDGMGLYEFVAGNPLAKRDPVGTGFLRDWVAAAKQWEEFEARAKRPCCGDRRYDPEGECCKNPERSEVVAVCSPPKGFVVAAGQIQEQGGPNETPQQQSLRTTGNYLTEDYVGKSLIGHTAVYYNGRLLLHGQGARGSEQEMTDLSDQVTWDLWRSREGNLRWGEAKGLACKCATAEMITDCLLSSPRPMGAYSTIYNNCQQDTEHAVHGCCLRGFRATCVSPDPLKYMTREQLKSPEHGAESLQVEHPELFQPDPFGEY